MYDGYLMFLILGLRIMGIYRFTGSAKQNNIQELKQRIDQGT